MCSCLAQNAFWKCKKTDEKDLREILSLSLFHLSTTKELQSSDAWLRPWTKLGHFCNHAVGFFIRFPLFMPAGAHANKYTIYDFYKVESCITRNRAVAGKPRDAAAVLFGLKFADNIHYKFKSIHASKARLQCSKHAGAKQNLTQNGHSRPFEVTCFEVSGKAMRDSCWSDRGLLPHISAGHVIQQKYGFYDKYLK